MAKFQNKYRIASARAQWWDYGWNGAYFITICTKQRRHFFGEINNGKMELSHLGVIADILWHEIPNRASFISLGDFVVMPVTKHANRLGFTNGWQARFHDHIIRNDAEYQRISNYIIKNPVNWKGDKFHSA